jgi:hypothetical protein
MLLRAMLLFEQQQEHSCQLFLPVSGFAYLALCWAELVRSVNKRNPKTFCCTVQRTAILHVCMYTQHNMDFPYVCVLFLPR